jgi:uncharacterized protein (TIGR00369 family)
MDDPLHPLGGFADLVGYRLGQWREDYAEILLEVDSRHLNRSGVPHGGVLTTLIDAACGYAGCHAAAPGVTRRAFTLSLECHFIAATAAGDRLTVSARRTGGGRQVFFSRAEVHDQNGRLIAQGAGVYRYRRLGGAS